MKYLNELRHYLSPNYVGEYVVEAFIFIFLFQNIYTDKKFHIPVFQTDLFKINQRKRG